MQPHPPETPKPRSGRPAARDLLAALALGAGALLLYAANGDFLPASDPVPSVYLPISLLEEGNLTFTPEEMPCMFLWTLQTDQGPLVVKFNRWDEVPREEATLRVRGPDAPLPQDRTWRELRRAGRLKPWTRDYFILPAAPPHQGEYVSGYGIGAGLTALPFYAAATASGTGCWWIWRRFWPCAASPWPERSAHARPGGPPSPCAWHGPWGCSSSAPGRTTRSAGIAGAPTW